MASAKRYERFGEHLPTGMVILDASFRVKLINPAARRIFGFAPGAVCTRNSGEPAWKELLENLQRSIRSGLPLTARLAVVRKERRVYRVQVIPWRDGTSEAVGILEDVTSQADFLEARQRFLDDASHRLHSPLSAIGGAASLLRRGQVGESPEDQTKVLEIIREEHENLARIISEMLTLLRLDNGLLAFRWETLDLDREILAAVAERESEASALGLSLHYRPAGKPSVIRGSRRLVREMIRGLLSLVLVHADCGELVNIRLHGFSGGGVDGSASGDRAGDEGGEAKMEIGVEGVTTPAAGEVRGESPALWEQAEEAPPVWRVVLLMCRTVVEAHHGRLETAARPQEGRSFAVFFPRG